MREYQEPLLNSKNKDKNEVYGGFDEIELQEIHIKNKGSETKDKNEVQQDFAIQSKIRIVDTSTLEEVKVVSFDSKERTNGKAQKEKDYKSEKIKRDDKPENHARHKKQSQAQNSCTWYLRRFLVRDSIITQLAVYSRLRGFNCDRANFLNDKSFWRQGPTLPFKDERAIQTAISTTQFFNGAGFITETLWPPTLLGLLSYDIYKFYSAPEERFGNTLKSIFIGIWNTPETLSTHFCSDIPGQTAYYLAPAILLSAPLIAGLVQCMMHRKSYISLRRRSESSRNKPSSIEEKELAVCWHGQDEMNGFARCQEVLGEIISEAKSSNVLTKIRAFRALSSIADRFQELPLPIPLPFELPLPLPTITNTPRESHKSIEEIRNKAKDELLKVSNNSSWFFILFGHYLLWTIKADYTESCLRSLFFYLISSINLYAKYRFLEIPILKAIGFINDWRAESSCHAPFVYALVSQIGEKVCAVCPDWASGNPGEALVYYGDIYTSQSCLSGLLRQSRDPERLAKLIEIPVKHGSFWDLDLTQQDWANWNDETWCAFLENITQTKNLHLKSFNLKRSDQFTSPVSQAKIECLADFTRQVPIQSLNLANLNLGKNATIIFQRGFHNATQYLNLEGNNLADEIAPILAHHISLLPQLDTLILNKNELTGEGLKTLSHSFTTLTTLSIQDNNLDEEGCKAISQVIPISKINYLDISYNSLSPDEFEIIALNFPYLDTFIASNCGISYSHLVSSPMHLQKSKIKNYDFSYNRISARSVITLIENIKNQNKTILNISNNEFDDNEIYEILNAFNRTNFQGLYLDGHPISQQHTALLSQLINDNLQILSLKNCEINDEMSQSLMLKPNKLQRIDLSNNKLTYQAPFHLFRNASPTLKHVNLSGNKLTGSFFANSSISQAICKQITSIDLSHNKIRQEVLAFTNYLNLNCSLTFFSIKGNPVDDSVILGISERLTGPLPSQNMLTKKHLLVSQERYLHKKTVKQTRLERLDFSQTDITTLGGVSVCRTLEHSGISISNLHATGNKIDSAELDIITCQTSSASARAKPTFIFNYIPNLINSLPKLNLLGMLTHSSSHLLKTLTQVPNQNTLEPPTIRLTPNVNNTSPTLVLLLALLSGTLVVYLLYRIFNYPSPQQETNSLRETTRLQAGLFRQNRMVDKAQIKQTQQMTQTSQITLTLQ